MSALTPEQRSSIMLANMDTSDCGVIAIQAVTGWPRGLAEQRCRELGGFTDDRGTPRGGLEQVLNGSGEFTAERLPGGRGYRHLEDTPATFAVSHEYGLYLVYIEKHVMALCNGDLHNSRGCWHKPVDGVTLVKPVGAGGGTPTT